MLGIFAGFNPWNNSFTYILATRRGVPLKLSSRKSMPKISIMALKCGVIAAIFSSSVLSKASARNGVSTEEALCSSPISSINKLLKSICSSLSGVVDKVSFCFIQPNF